MTFDYKKEYKEFYLPPKKPGIIDIPEINYIAIQGKGDPNEPDGEYKNAMGLLYGIAFTLKMSYKGEHKIDGYFPYVVPPLEGLWYQDGSDGDIDYSRKQDLRWVSMIRLPEFVTRDEFDWAVREATERKKTDFSKVLKVAGKRLSFLNKCEVANALGASIYSIKTSFPLASIILTSNFPSSKTYKLQHKFPCFRTTVFSLISYSLISNVLTISFLT